MLQQPATRRRIQSLPTLCLWKKTRALNTIIPTMNALVSSLRSSSSKPLLTPSIEWLMNDVKRKFISITDSALLASGTQSRTPAQKKQGTLPTNLNFPWLIWGVWLLAKASKVPPSKGRGMSLPPLWHTSNWLVYFTNPTATKKKGTGVYLQVDWNSLRIYSCYDPTRKHANAKDHP